MTGGMDLRSWLMAWEFWMLEALLGLFLLTTALAVPRMVRAIGVKRRWWQGLAAIAVLAAAIGSAAPTTNRIFYDEQIYQDVGQNLAEIRRAQMCNHGIVEYGRLQCLAAEYNKEPYGYPHLLGVAYRLFGTSDRIAPLVNRGVHVLMVVVIALAAVRWLGDPRAALVSALFMTVVPEQLRWSATAAAEPTAALFALVAVLAAAEFSRSRTNVALAWAVAASAWAVQFRPESVLILLVVAAIVATTAPDEFRRPRIWIAAAVGAVLLAGYGAHVLAIRNESWGAAAAPFSTSYFGPNLAVNGWFYLWDHRFPGWMTALAIGGCLAGGAALRARITAAGYFAVFFAVFLFFYAGSYDYGADVRYSLLTYAPLVMLAGLGTMAAIDRVPMLTGRRRAAAAFVATGVVWWLTLSLPYVRSVGEEAWAARADVRFAREVAAELPSDALVLTQDPNMFLLWGRNAAQLSFASAPGFLEGAMRRHGGGVFVHWGFWCNVVDPVQHQICEAALAAAPHAVAREHRERDYRYVFYRMETAAAATETP